MNKNTFQISNLTLILIISCSPNEQQLATTNSIVSTSENLTTSSSSEEGIPTTSAFETSNSNSFNDTFEITTLENNSTSTSSTSTSTQVTSEVLITSTSSVSSSTSSTLDTNFTGTSLSETTIGFETESEIRGSIVFITSLTFNGDFSLISPDDQCQNLAKISSIPGTFKAWLSFNDENALDRVSSISPPLVLLNGDEFSPTLEDLVNGNISNPLNIDENQNILNREVWTSTNPNGTLTIGNNCLNWTNNTNSPGFFGNSSFTSGDWTMFGTKAECKDFKSLYCFQVE